MVYYYILVRGFLISSVIRST